ncbi:hypothetical protein F3I62_03585 [Pseudomonas sp. R-28-1W-6]|uniref:hypothetical protein n=1 Tax=Pseudomonas sp. R-28-1W-6 TaxID=2650101 RepID=UPI00136674C0|nr:hypothetical protein [Pseudomonas sp. R-28-1W-6]MWV11170.1 hypothetical protein [Pseudomonas sp. R-28-1W-6]
MGRPVGSVKTGGRRPGSLDRQQRQLITEQMAFDVLAVYRGLGGAMWLMEFAKANPGQFVQQCLSRLLPAAPKEDADVQVNMLSVGNISDFEIARRLAFVLAAGANAQQDLQEQQPPVTVQETPGD